MILTSHQPIFLPWPGFFVKLLRADVTVILDRVQFPLAAGWMTRNRIKSPAGDLWLTVPVRRKGQGKQSIDQVRLCNDLPWREKHMRSLRENYARAPYRDDYLPQVAAIYRKWHTHLVDFNVELIRFLAAALDLQSKLALQSETGVEHTGSALPSELCRCFSADAYCALPSAGKYLDRASFMQAGLGLERLSFQPPIYPQLWGDFRYNLSMLDLLLTCGPRARRVLEDAAAVPAMHDAG